MDTSFMFIVEKQTSRFNNPRKRKTPLLTFVKQNFYLIFRSCLDSDVTHINAVTNLLHYSYQPRHDLVESRTIFTKQIN